MPSLLRKLHLPVKKKEDAAVGEFNCQVTLLHEDKPLEFKFHVDTLGEGVFAKVCEVIGNLEEKDYFGLRFNGDDHQRRWLDVGSPAFKQLKHLSPIIVSFRVKHYPPHPTDNLKQDLAKYLLFHQLKRDLLNGRLYSVTSGDTIFLAACIVQAEFGDYDEIENYEQCEYLSDITLIHNQTPKIESRIYEEHRNLKGKTSQEIESMFLQKAFALDTYGIDPRPVRDRNGNSLFLGLSHKAVVTFHGSKLTHSFPWESINSIQFHDKMLLLDVNLTHEELTNSTDFKYKKRHLLGFKCESKAAASALWAWSLEQQLFFTLNKGTEARVMKAKTGLFKQRHNSFRFSGRSQKELLTCSDYFLNLNQTAPGFVRLQRARSSRNSPRVRRLRSVRSPSLSGSSDSDNLSTASQSRREQHQRDGDQQDESRFATFPRRSKPDGGLGGAPDGSTPRRRPPLTDGAAGTAAAASDAAAASVLVHESSPASAGGGPESGLGNTIAEDAEGEAAGDEDAAAAAAGDAPGASKDKDTDSGVVEEAVVVPVVSAAAAAAAPSASGDAADGDGADEAMAQLNRVLDDHDEVDGEFAAAHSEDGAGADAASAEPPDGDVASKAKAKKQQQPSRCRCLRAFFLLTVGVSLLTVLGVVLLFEAGPRWAPDQLAVVRAHPLGHDLHERLYGPARARLLEVGAAAAAAVGWR